MTVGKNNNMTPIGHRKAVDLRFDADDGGGISLEPFNIDLVAKVANAREVGMSRQQFIDWRRLRTCIR